ncbi:hypothetical protein ANCCAN_15095 [Ancylostoma caninum]|uniref:Transposase Tc1-like domain-containing protein n=1 Tax=Ancylostoma caninum TaxID=29170 RepID=A0A368G3S6_ANCCA|nr:hypothetical protein ANCCAN_15095 [Ancylostoma caninum]
MRAQLGLNVSKMTIWRSVQRNTKITREIMRKALRLTPQHKEAHLLFARSNMTTQWDKVIFSDEKSSTWMDPMGIVIIGIIGGGT